MRYNYINTYFSYFAMEIYMLFCRNVAKPVKVTTFVWPCMSEFYHVCNMPFFISVFKPF